MFNSLMSDPDIVITAIAHSYNEGASRSAPGVMDKTEMQCRALSGRLLIA